MILSRLKALVRRNRHSLPDTLPEGTRIEWRHRAVDGVEHNNVWLVTGHRRYFDLPHVELTNVATDVVKLVSLNGLASTGAVRVLAKVDAGEAGPAR